MADLSQPDPVLRVRLSNVLYSLDPPLDDLDRCSGGFSRGHAFTEVPVVRVLGITEAGQRACVNIHGAYPYMYIGYPKDRAMDPDSVRRYISRLGAALNLALRPPYRKGLPEHLRKTGNAIHSIVLCKGTPIYGYRVGYAYYLRIAYLDPGDRWRILRCLHEGAIMGGRKEVYEGHLGFVLQFLCDFGLAGCGWLDLGDVRFRSLPEGDDSASPDLQDLLPSRERRWTTLNTPDHYLLPHAPRPSARTALELDVHVSAILNRLRIVPRDVHAGFGELLEGARADRKLVDSLEELWEDERRRQRAKGRGGLDGGESLGKLSYGSRLGAADAVPGKDVGWSSEPRWWAEVAARIEHDRAALADQGVDSRTRRLEDLLTHAAGRKETACELAQFDRYIPTAFRALTRGWRGTPLPSRAPEPLPAQSQHLPERVLTLDDAPAAVQPPATPSGGRATNVFTGIARHTQADDLAAAATTSPGLDVDSRLVFAATQHASQLEADERRRAAGEALDGDRAALGGEGLRGSLGAGQDGRDDDDGEAEEDDEGETLEPWGEDSGFKGDLSQVGELPGARLRRRHDGAGSSSAGDGSSVANDTPGAQPLVDLSTPPGLPSSRAPYPHAQYFSPASTAHERKSRSPRSAVRTSPVKLVALRRERNTPGSPSTLRTVRFAQVQRTPVGKAKKEEPDADADDDDDDDDEQLEDSPSANRTSQPHSSAHIHPHLAAIAAAGGSTAKTERSAAAFDFTFASRPPARPDFGSPSAAAGKGKGKGRALAPVSSFSVFGTPRKADVPLPSFVPPTFPASLEPKDDVADEAAEGAALGEAPTVAGDTPPLGPPILSIMEADDDLERSPSPSPGLLSLDTPDADADADADAGAEDAAPWQPTYVSPSSSPAPSFAATAATAAAVVEDDERSLPSSPESETLVMLLGSPGFAPRSSSSSTPAPVEEDARRLGARRGVRSSAMRPRGPEETERPLKRARFADVDEEEEERDGEAADEGEVLLEGETSSREEPIPAAQTGFGMDVVVQPPTQVEATALSSLEQTGSSAEQVNTSMDVSLTLLAPLSLPSSADSTAPYGPLGVHRAPYYSNPADLPRTAREYAGRLWAFETHAREEDEEPLGDVYERQQGTFLGQVGKGVGSARLKRRRRDEGVVEELEGKWEFAFKAFTRGEAKCWLEKDVSEEKKRRKHFLESQHAGSTQKNTQGFKFSQIDDSSRHREKRFMSVMVLELLIETRPGRLPIPEKDPIVGAFFALQSDGEAPDNCYLPGCHIGFILVAPESSSIHGDEPCANQDPRRLADQDVRPVFVQSELDLIHRLVEQVWTWDPDILSGWEVQSRSWGYVTHRLATYGASDGQEQFITDLSPLLNPRQRKASDYDQDHHSVFQVEGRHVFNLWRMLRSELNLNQYTFENVAFHLLKRRVPRFTANTLWEKYASGVPAQTAHAIEFIFSRVLMVVEMLDLSELVSRTAEFARVYGVDFADVFQRGSQFKVESMMFRIGKPESLLFLTPTKEDVSSQQSTECQPLIMEPQSAFYKDPVVVLDFQSLYPSIMLAYNICYSTCLGRADRLKDKHGRPTDRFGFSQYEMAPGDLELLEEYITISPNGVMFVKPTLRKSLLAKMLGELLDTRVMIKQAMKGHKEDKNLTRTLNSRQLALKLLANVTYGYTSASFSGRMPHVQMADAIVQYGRESLEKAIELIHSTPKWDSRVVYGDTDSLFIHMPGRSKEDAFRIGHEIADAITAINPKPMKMKFEKVYLPCVLQAKKRYVGFKYENPDDKEPVFDDKGIETVRRDTIPAQQKELEALIKILFRSQDLSEAKKYMYEQWTNIMRGRVLVQDFTFAKEVRLGGYKEKSKPAHAIVAAVRLQEDPGDIVQYGERVPYVIVKGEPGEAQYKRARRPEELVLEEGLELDDDYYINKVLIPPMTRIANLCGADIEQWFKTMPRPKPVPKAPFALADVEAAGGNTVKAVRKNKAGENQKMTDFLQSDQCFLCHTPTSNAPTICDDCRHDPISTSLALIAHVSKNDHRVRTTQAVCASCASTPAYAPVPCVSIDCPVLYKREGARLRAKTLEGIPAFVQRLLDDADGPAEIIDLS